jgi:hypothetical protein
MQDSSIVPKDLLELLIQRKEASEKLMELDVKVDNILESLGLVDNQEYYKLQNDYGCLMYTQPYSYYRMVVEYIEKQLSK